MCFTLALSLSSRIPYTPTTYKFSLTKSGDGYGFDNILL